MGALTASLIALVAIGLGWVSIEIACKPCLEQGRAAIDRNLNPNYDPDDDDDSYIQALLNPPNPSNVQSSSDSNSTSVVKTVD